MAKVRYDFDPMKLTGVKVPRASRADARDEVADFVKEQILSRTADGRTSVKGGKWKRTLSPEYKKKKSEESSADFANLELTGDMLDALETSVVGKNIRIEVAGDEAGKAEGNLTGSYGRSPNLKNARQFMPVDDQELSPEIVSGIKKILQRYEDDDG